MTRSRAFTLVEVMVATVILAILAALVVPRLTANTRRTFDLIVAQVGDLLVMYAQRDQLGRRPVALVSDPDARTLELMILDSETDEIGASSVWRTDHFVKPVRLPPLIDFDAITVYADGELVDIRNWPLTSTPGERRPSIEVYLRTEDQAYEAMLRLAPHAVAPERVGYVDFPYREPVDLDAVGRSQEDW